MAKIWQNWMKKYRKIGWKKYHKIGWKFPRKIERIIFSDWVCKPYVFENGSLARAITASASLPSIFKPIEINGRLYTDGGVVNNYPIHEVKSKGVDIIIGVNVAKKIILTRVSKHPKLSKMTKNDTFLIINFYPSITSL